MSTPIFPFLGPLMIGLAFNSVVERQKDVREVELSVVGVEHAPELVAFLQAEGVVVTDAPDDPRDAVANGEEAAGLVISEEFGQKIAESKPAPVELIVDGSRHETRPTQRRVDRLLRVWSAKIGSLRLVSRGVDPQITRALAVQEVEVASAQKRGAKALDFLPMFVIMAAFLGSLQIAVDTTAGERERNSLEALLINPVPRTALVLGKWLAAVVFAAVAVVLTLGLTLHLGLGAAVGILAATWPLALMAAGLQILVASFARSFKEAQTYLSLLMLLPMLPSFIASLWELGDAPWMIPVPALGQQVILARVIGGESAAWWEFFGR
jgi:sodium transport system permease protein